MEQHLTFLHYKLNPLRTLANTFKTLLKVFAFRRAWERSVSCQLYLPPALKLWLFSISCKRQELTWREPPQPDLPGTAKHINHLWALWTQSFKNLFYKYRDKKSLDSLLFAWLQLKISGEIFPNLKIATTTTLKAGLSKTWCKKQL